MYFATAYFVHDFEDNFQAKTVAHLHKLITIKKESGITLYYLLIPSSNENNLIYLRSSEWGKNFKNNKLQVVAPCWVMYSSKIRLAPETNNKALIQNIIILMTHIVAVLSYFLAILSWNKMHIVASLIYFPTSLSWNMTHMVTALSHFLASLSSNMTQIVAALRCTTWKVILFGVILVRIWAEYGEILRISPYSVRMRENADQNNSEYRHFSRSGTSQLLLAERWQTS